MSVHEYLPTYIEHLKIFKCHKEGRLFEFLDNYVKRFPICPFCGQKLEGT